MINYQDILFLESFDLGNTLPYKKLTPQKTIGLMSNVYYEKYKEQGYELEDIVGMLKKQPIKFGYQIDAEDDILLFMMDYVSYIEFHFINLTHSDEMKNLNSLGTTSTSVFSTIVEIILDNVSKGKDIHILASDNRVKLYSGIIKRVLKQHKSDWEVFDVEDKKEGVKVIKLRQKLTESHFYSMFKEKK